VSTLCLPDITAHDQISRAFLPILPTASDQILEVGTAWEQGYPTTVFSSFYLSLFGFLSTSLHVVESLSARKAFSDSVCKLFHLVYTGTLDLFDVDGEYVYSAQVCV